MVAMMNTTISPQPTNLCGLSVCRNTASTAIKAALTVSGSRYHPTYLPNSNCGKPRMSCTAIAAMMLTASMANSTRVMAKILGAPNTQSGVGVASTSVSVLRSRSRQTSSPA